MNCFKSFFNSIDPVKLILSLVLGFGGGFLIYYIFLPPFNIHSTGFWLYLTAVAVAFCLPYIDVKTIIVKSSTAKRKVKYKSRRLGVGKIPAVIIALPIAVIIIGMIFSSEVFSARKYASVIEVNESVFSEDLPETTEITNIALMDTPSATILGNRTLGSLSHVVSQYKVSEYYTQINYNGSPKKVANLEYDGFFKWAGNMSNGIPGMVMVDPVKSSAEYVEFNSPMYYAESSYFGHDLERKLRFSYPTKIFNSISFEVDEEGNPYYIVSCAKPQVSLFGAYDINEVIIFNPCDGTSIIKPVEDAPSWIDIVYTGYLATDKFNWYGRLSGGFVNSIIGNVGCKEATDDFGYVALGDDVWYFTGVTSAVSEDKSNIGFILSNARTGEYKFYSVIGAEEHSAMAAAEGEVQEKGYVASFPSLVNISGQATYIMVLKDDAGLVKLYALVNVENYSIVATGTTQSEAMSAYKKLLKQNNVQIGDSDKKAHVTVEDVRIVNMAGVTTVYITDVSGDVYKGYLEADESLILVRCGDKLSVTYSESENDRIFVIYAWSFEE